LFVDLGRGSKMEEIDMWIDEFGLETKEIGGERK
jgi:hypothetical protein